MTDPLPTSGGDPQVEYDALCKAVGDLLIGPDHPAITEAAFKQEREKYTELQAGQVELTASIEELELVIPNIEAAEKLLTAIQADLVTHKDALSDFAAELGSTAFAGLQAGELGDNAHFTMRKELQTKIDTQLQQRALLISGSDAGIFEKTKNKARQLKLTGQIKLLNLKIKGTDRSLGDLLLSAEDDDVIQCSYTEKLLDTIANQRRKLRASKEALSQAESSLAEKKAYATETLGRAGVPDAASLKLELNATRSKENVNSTDIANIRASVVSKALDYEWLRDDDELRDKLEELAALRTQLPSTHSSNPNRRKSSDNGNAESLQTIEHNDTRQPTLWNPNAAGFWSLLLTPAFGAWLHAKNWKELGHPDKAKTSMLWVYAFIAILITIWFVSAATSQIPRVIFGGFLAAWWMKSGNKQYKLVKEQYPGYHKKGWARPILIAAVSLVWLIGLALAAANDMDHESAQEHSSQYLQNENAELKPTEDEQSAGKVLNSNELGWSIQMPVNWTLIASEEVVNLIERGDSKLEAFTGHEVETTDVRPLICFEKDKGNHFKSMLRTLSDDDKKNYDAIVAENMQATIDILKNNDIQAKIYDKERINIDGLDFTTFVIELQAEDGTVFMRQHLYFRLFEDKEFSVVISYMDETSGNTLLSSWTNSTFTNQRNTSNQ